MERFRADRSGRRDDRFLFLHRIVPRRGRLRAQGPSRAEAEKDRRRRPRDSGSARARPRKPAAIISNAELAASGLSPRNVSRIHFRKPPRSRIICRNPKKNIVSTKFSPGRAFITASAVMRAASRKATRPPARSSCSRGKTCAASENGSSAAVFCRGRQTADICQDSTLGCAARCRRIATASRSKSNITPTPIYLPLARQSGRGLSRRSRSIGG